MAVKIRLSRHGKKGYAFFHIVVADGRSPRDGRYIEQIGIYNPNTNPATIVLNSEKALYWLTKGAQPSPTARRILSYEGVMLRKHLQGGVEKGAFTQEVADQKWAAWKMERDKKTSDKKASVSKKSADAHKAAIAEEAKVNTFRAEAIAKKKAEEEAARKAAEEAARAAAEAEAAAQEAPAQEAETPAEA